MYCVLGFVFAVMSAIRCVPLVNLKHSDNLQNSSTLLATLNTFDILNTMNVMCRRNESKKGTDELIYYCRDLIKENDIYLPLKYIIGTKISEIRSSLIKLLNLENKAIVCRGIRHLLPIIMYGTFINNTINGSTGNGNYGLDAFEELFKKKLDLLNDENSRIEKKFRRIKASTMKNGRTNNKLDERTKQSNGVLAVTSSSIMENIITTVQLILPFIEKLDCFHNLYKIDKVMTANKSDHNLLLLIFDEVKIMYRTECNADVDAAALLQNRGWKFERKYHSIPLLVKEIDRLSVALQKDLQSLFVKFLSTLDPKRPLQQCPDVSIVFYHTFNKYHDPEVWRLIGNEVIVDHSSDPGKAATTSIDKVATNLSEKIQGTTNRLTALITKKVKCRCYTYLNLLIKLFYCSARVLAANMREVRRSTQSTIDLERIDQHKVYSLLHDEIKGLWTAECFIGDDVSAIDELLDRDGRDKYFRSAYAAYWNRNARSVGKAIETVSNYSLDQDFVAGFGPLLQEIQRIQVQPEIEMKSIESLVNRYKWGEQAYKDHCFPGEYDDNVLTTFSNNTKQALQVTTDNTAIRLTLEWIMTMTDALNDDLEDDLDKINNTFS